MRAGVGVCGRASANVAEVAEEQESDAEHHHRHAHADGHLEGVKININNNSVCYMVETHCG